MSIDSLAYPEEAFRSWELYRRYYDVRFASVLNGLVKLELGSEPLILDSAAGEGYGTYLLESQGSDARVVSSDYDSAALSADRWLPDDESSPRVVSDYRAQPFASESFDGVLTISGVQTHFEDDYREKLDQDWLSETWRVLKPGGKVLITNDTPRGLRSIFNDPLLMEGIRLNRDELIVASFDDRNDIAQPIVVETEAMNAALADICAKLGITTLLGQEYEDLMQADRGEPFFIDIYARAAQKVLQADRGYRPFEFNSSDGSWNKLYYTQLIDDLERSPKRFRVKETQKTVYGQVPSEIITTPRGEELYVSMWRRDTVGNLYVAGLSKEETETADVEVATNFVVAQKI